MQIPAPFGPVLHQEQLPRSVVHSEQDVYERHVLLPALMFAGTYALVPYPMREEEEEEEEEDGEENEEAPLPLPLLPLPMAPLKITPSRSKLPARACESTQ